MAKDTIHIEYDQGKIQLPVNGGAWDVTSDQTYSAMELLIASIGVCSVSVFGDVLERSNIDAHLTKAHVTYSRVPREENIAMPVKSATVTFHVAAADEHARGRTERALPMIEKYCTVIQSVNKQIEITERVIFI